MKERGAAVAAGVLPSLARRAIEAHLEGGTLEPPRLPAPLDAPMGVFVTLKGPRGELRGCIGHIEPVFDTLAEEVVSCAVSAATRDPRFPPVGADELGALSLEVSLLHPPEPVDGLGDLDPARWGVVVERGQRRGVLLAGLEGIESAAEQVAIARRKAGIRPDEPVRLYRFAMSKVEEDPGPEEAV